MKLFPFFLPLALAASLASCNHPTSDSSEDDRTESSTGPTCFLSIDDDLPLGSHKGASLSEFNVTVKSEDYSYWYGPYGLSFSRDEGTKDSVDEGDVLQMSATADSGSYTKGKAELIFDFSFTVSETSSSYIWEDRCSDGQTKLVSANHNPTIR